MPTEVQSSTSITPSIPDIFEWMNQPDMSGDIAYWITDGKESLAASQEAALLQQICMETARHLFVKPASASLINTPMSTNLFPVLVDVSRLRQVARQQSPVDDPDEHHFATKLWTSLEDYPFEDGMGHPIEGIIAEEVGSEKSERVLQWLRSFCMDVSQPSFAASILRCLGRHQTVGTVSWRVELVRDGLAIDNVEIRDAAVHAAESWGDLEALDVLSSHPESEPWLRQYISDVMDDLTE